MKIGFMELLVIFIVALVVIGPDKLPQYARKLGSALRQFREASDELTHDIKESVIDPLEEAQKPLREAMEPLTELDESVRGNLKEVTKSFNDLGKEKPKPKEAPKTPEPQADGVSEPALEPSPAQSSPDAGEAPERPNQMEQNGGNEA